MFCFDASVIFLSPNSSKVFSLHFRDKVRIDIKVERDVQAEGEGEAKGGCRVR